MNTSCVNQMPQSKITIQTMFWDTVYFRTTYFQQQQSYFKSCCYISDSPHLLFWEVLGDARLLDLLSLLQELLLLPLDVVTLHMARRHQH